MADGGVARTTLYIPTKYRGLWLPAKFHARWGGRGSGKSWNVARRLALRAATEKRRILCTRQYQSSIKDSVHQTLKTQIEAPPPIGLGLGAYFDITTSGIYGKQFGSEFIFKGLQHNISEIKSTEGVTDTWVEEAHNVIEEAWIELLPTVFRNPTSEMFITWNQREEEAPVQKRFGAVLGPEYDVECVTYEDNPYFPAGLDWLRKRDQEYDPDNYEHIWGKEFRTIGSAVVFQGKAVVRAFETPTWPEPRWFHGMDFGFANDPSAVIRAFIQDGSLYIDEESFGYNVELEELPQLIDKIPTARKWPIKADNSRPETISFLRGKGFNISAAEKWQGSVEDGIAHLKGFKEIVIHERCKNLAQEARLYRYKVDRVTEEVLPIIVDKWNHGWDAARYSLDGFIQRRGNLAVWEALGRGR